MSHLMLGTLPWVPATTRRDLLAPTVAAALDRGPGDPAEVMVAPINPELADTAAFCDAYGVTLDVSANCVVVAGKRSGETRLAAVVVLATTRADVNNVVRRRIDARKASFAPMDLAVAETGMEYGGITPIGLPPAWPLLVDGAVVDTPEVIVGSGLRRSKLALPGAWLTGLPSADVVDGLGL
ncbi:MAG TPA: YbaK/EbsC family protein [Acidimicrobiales bacterium]|nr:YbaK/EbsC family protein [Acidimicrobiales bacterium]